MRNYADSIRLWRRDLVKLYQHKIQGGIKVKRTKRIRKVLAGVLVFILAISLSTACGSTEESPKKEAADTTSSDASEDTFGLNETAAFETLKMTALEMKESQGDEYIKADEGKVFVGVKFRIENISDSDEVISSILLFNAYVDGTKVDVNLMPPGDLSDGTLDGTLAAGKSMEGYYVVQAGSEWSEIQLDVQSSWLSNTKAEFVITK